MTLTLNSDQAQILLEVVEFYTSEKNIYAESSEARFLVYLLERLKGRKVRRRR